MIFLAILMRQPLQSGRKSEAIKDAVVAGTEQPDGIISMVRAMKKQHLVSIFLFLTTLLFLLPGSAAANDIKDRMHARLPEIVDLKARGIVGEDNKGFLQFVGGSREKAGLVQAENGDRQQVYAAIARQQGTTADLVGRRRAKQLADMAAPGTYVQDANGNWRKK